MSDELAAHFTQGMTEMRARGRFVDDYAAEVLDEMLRARAEETRLSVDVARLLEEATEKEKRITALEKALVCAVNVVNLVCARAPVVAEEEGLAAMGDLQEAFRLAAKVSP